MSPEKKGPLSVAPGYLVMMGHWADLFDEIDVYSWNISLKELIWNFSSMVYCFFHVGG